MGCLQQPLGAAAQLSACAAPSFLHVVLDRIEAVPAGARKFLPLVESSAVGGCGGARPRLFQLACGFCTGCMSRVV